MALPMPPPHARSLRSHQRQLLGVAHAIAAGEPGLRDVLAAVTPGGGKSLLPVLMAQVLVRAGIVDRICWVVPRDSLRLQAEEAFADPAWRAALGHGLSVRAAENLPDPCRGLNGYVTTYQGVAAAPDLHLTEFRRHRYLLVVDEVHHLPALAELDPGLLPSASGEAAATWDEAAGWSQALLPLLECACVRLLLSGTLERADGRGILWLPYRRGPRLGTRQVDLNAPGLAVIGYSRAQALAERAVLPVTFGALDGEARWRDDKEREVGPHRLRAPVPTPETRPALFTALRTGFAETLLQEAFLATRRLRAERRAAQGLTPGAVARGLGKLLVVAPDQITARYYLERLRRWLPADQAAATARLAISERADAHETLAAFRLLPEPSILITVAMAYEGLDAPEVAVVAALTQIRSRPWLEQMVARATRLDPWGGPYETQRALVFHPDDPFFARFRERMEAEQGLLARRPRLREQGSLELSSGDDPAERSEIVPLESNALGLRFTTLAPGPELGLRRPERQEAQDEVLEPPHLAERRLRARIGEMVATQVVEDAAELRAPRGQGTYHAYNAALKRALGGKSRAQMTLAELEAAVAWLERNRIGDYLHLLDGDHRYGWVARRRTGANWRPPVGRRTAAR